MIDLLGLNLGEMEDFVRGIGERPFRATQILKWIYNKGVFDIGEMTDLSKDFRSKLLSHARISTITPEDVKISADGTTKFLFRLEDGESVESVLIFEDKRTTLCVSSQVGCPLGCTFCLTGKMGFVRNLGAHEIVGQILAVKDYQSKKRGPNLRITNVVFMGMGEPLLNFDEVSRAVDIITSDWGLGFSWRRVTLSTAGIPKGILEIGRLRSINLAVSLNAPDDETRDQIMPINKRYPLRDLIGALREYPLKRGRRITLEYVMLSGINDSPESARALISLIKGLKVKINLIPFNPFTGASYERPDDDTVERFRDILIGANLNAIVRDSRGGDISAACGQLSSRSKGCGNKV
jgi:23S rRNA (adenine2503-C2)-methyltransferase